MTTVAIIYHSGTGHTEKMAEAVAKGASSVQGIDVKLLAITPEQIVGGRWKDETVIQQLDTADAIIFGSPTYMGSVSGQFKAFADATGQKYFSRAWQDKIAAGFTVSGGLSGDKLNTLITMSVLAAQLGMIWVGLGETQYTNDQGINRLGGHLGAMGQALQEPVDVTPNAEDKLTGESLGKRVAEITKRFSHGG